ncbi:A disintegrin and metalloproteinase with thrombospondin motifs 7-like [Macaca fascicularis]|uniref:A disintegrin and metalloproteinase with thrombospondin motifs 7-like n=1 Tax=Macaca fascicularis TaxID=9541 RepID=UPI003D15E78C
MVFPHNLTLDITGVKIEIETENNARHSAYEFRKVFLMERIDRGAESSKIRCNFTQRERAPHWVPYVGSSPTGSVGFSPHVRRREIVGIKTQGKETKDSWGRGTTTTKTRRPAAPPPSSHPISSHGWGLCLDDPPAKDIIDFSSVPPGILYDVSHQCRLQYGAYSAFCEDMDNVCHTLWCSVGTTCHSKLDAAVDSTQCGENKRLGAVPPASASHACNLSQLFNSPLQRQPKPHFIQEEIEAQRLAEDLPMVTQQVGGRAQASCCHLPTGPYKQGGCVWARGWAAQGREALCTKLGGRDLGVWVQEEAACSGLWPGSSIHQALGPTPLIPTDPNTKADTVWVSGSTSTSASCRPAPLAAPPSATSSAATLTLHSTRASCTQGCPWSMTNVGCDFKIDSGAMEDHCGVCHGNDSTCHTVCRGRMDTARSSKQGPWTRRTVPPWASPMTARGSAVAALPCQMVGR